MKTKISKKDKKCITNEFLTKSLKEISEKSIYDDKGEVRSVRFLDFNFKERRYELYDPKFPRASLPPLNNTKNNFSFQRNSHDISIYRNNNCSEEKKKILLKDSNTTLLKDEIGNIIKSGKKENCENIDNYKITNIDKIGLTTNNLLDIYQREKDKKNNNKNENVKREKKDKKEDFIQKAALRLNFFSIDKLIKKQKKESEVKKENSFNKFPCSLAQINRMEVNKNFHNEIDNKLNNNVEEDEIEKKSEIESQSIKINNNLVVDENKKEKDYFRQEFENIYQKDFLHKYHNQKENLITNHFLYDNKTELEVLDKENKIHNNFEESIKKEKLNDSQNMDVKGTPKNVVRKKSFEHNKNDENNLIPLNYINQRINSNNKKIENLTQENYLKENKDEKKYEKFSISKQVKYSSLVDSDSANNEKKIIDNLTEKSTSKKKIRIKLDQNSHKNFEYKINKQKLNFVIEPQIDKNNDKYDSLNVLKKDIMAVIPTNNNKKIDIDENAKNIHLNGNIEKIEIKDLNHDLEKNEKIENINFNEMNKNIHFNQNNEKIEIKDLNHNLEKNEMNKNIWKMVSNDIPKLIDESKGNTNNKLENSTFSNNEGIIIKNVKDQKEEHLNYENGKKMFNFKILDNTTKSNNEELKIIKNKKLEEILNQKINLVFTKHNNGVSGKNIIIEQEKEINNKNETSNSSFNNMVNNIKKKIMIKKSFHEDKDVIFENLKIKKKKFKEGFLQKDTTPECKIVINNPNYNKNILNIHKEESIQKNQENNYNKNETIILKKNEEKNENFEIQNEINKNMENSKSKEKIICEKKSKRKNLEKLKDILVKNDKLIKKRKAMSTTDINSNIKRVRSISIKNSQIKKEIKKIKSVLLKNSPISSDKSFVNKDDFIKYWKYIKQKKRELSLFNDKLKKILISVEIIKKIEEFDNLQKEVINFKDFLKELILFKIIKNKIDLKKKNFIKKLFTNIKQCCSQVTKIDFYVFLLFVYKKEHENDFLKPLFRNKIDFFDFYQIKEKIRLQKKFDLNFIKKMLQKKTVLSFNNQTDHQQILHVNIFKDFRTSYILEN